MAEEEDGGGSEELPNQIDAEQARVLIAGGKVRVIDIRSEDDFAEERMSNAIRSDPDEIESALEDRETGRDAVLVVCEDGSRSAEVAEQLRSNGTDATSIDGGFKAWTGDHMPTAPTDDEEYEGPAIRVPGAVDSSGEEEEEEEDEEEDEASGDDSGEAEVNAEGDRAELRDSETVDSERAERAEEA